MCNCGSSSHERLGIDWDRTDAFETVYYWICRSCGFEWSE